MVFEGENVTVSNKDCKEAEGSKRLTTNKVLRRRVKNTKYMLKKQLLI